MALNLILFVIGGYLLGSIPFGFLISKAKSVDIREVGSGNIGATNVIRALGIKWALPVVVADLLKGAIPVYLAQNLLGLDWQILAVALAPILGHTFPVWLSFKGGKGVATTFGVLAVLLGWKLFSIWLLVWVLCLAVFKIMSFTNLIMSSFLPLFLWLSSFSLFYFIFGIIIFSLFWWAHRENLQRIKEGTEPKFQLKQSIDKIKKL